MLLIAVSVSVFFFFLKDTATTAIYTLSLHDALPICVRLDRCRRVFFKIMGKRTCIEFDPVCSGDRKSTRLNSSHVEISYAVFCLKKKKKIRALDRSGPHANELSSNLDPRVADPPDPI